MLIYLLECIVDDNVVYKIGKTKNDVHKRIQNLQTGNASKIEVVCTYETKYANIMERILHKDFSKYRLNGEWFSDEIYHIDFIKKCSEIENRLKMLKNKGNPFI
jgi:hypothetical protein